MSYNPVPGKDLRITYDATTESYQIEQVRTRTANGATNPNDLGGILDLGQEGWEVRFSTDNIAEVLAEMFSIAYQEDVGLRSVDFGPVSNLSPEVTEAVTRMQLLTF
jgi:hypothetical protein